MRQAAGLRQLTSSLATLQQRLADALELAALEDPALADDLAKEVLALGAELDRRETEAMLSGRYDQGERDPGHSRRRRRHRLAGLGRHAAAHVLALGGAIELCR